MVDDKVYRPEVIEEIPFPNQEAEASYTPENKTSGGNTQFYPSTTKESPLPSKKIATELISSVLNTKTRKITNEIQFIPSGALQMGNYQEGLYGDIRISGRGIVTRNVSGDTTFALDSETGDAVFAGIVQTGTLISGKVLVGDGSIEIDGSPDKRRMLFYDADGLPSIIIGLLL